jgi:hypothetical protein
MTQTSAGEPPTTSKLTARLRQLWAGYSLSLTLGMLWLFSWGMQTYSGWREFSLEQLAHGQTVEISEYVWVWLRTTFENNASEFLQLLTFVVLTTYLVHRGSHESKDTDERVQTQLDRIEQRLASLSPPQRDGGLAPAGGAGAGGALRDPATGAPGGAPPGSPAGRGGA